MFGAFMKNIECLLSTYEIEITKTKKSWKVRCNLKENVQQQQELEQEFNSEVPSQLIPLVKRACKIKEDLKKNNIIVNELHLARKLQIEISQAKTILEFIVK